MKVSLTLGLTEPLTQISRGWTSKADTFGSVSSIRSIGIRTIDEIPPTRPRRACVTQSLLSSGSPILFSVIRGGGDRRRSIASAEEPVEAQTSRYLVEWVSLRTPSWPFILGSWGLDFSSSHPTNDDARLLYLDALCSRSPPLCTLLSASGPRLSVCSRAPYAAEGHLMVVACHLPRL